MNFQRNYFMEYLGNTITEMNIILMENAVLMHYM